MDCYTFVALSSLFGSDVGSDKIEVAYNIENINIITSVETVDYKNKKIYMTRFQVIRKTY